MALKLITVSELKAGLAGIVARLEREPVPVYVTQHGKPKVVLLKYEEYEALRDRIEDLEDALAMREALARPEDEALRLDEYERGRASPLRG